MPNPIVEQLPFGCSSTFLKDRICRKVRVSTGSSSCKRDIYPVIMRIDPPRSSASCTWNLIRIPTIVMHCLWELRSLQHFHGGRDGVSLSSGVGYWRRGFSSEPPTVCSVAYKDDRWRESQVIQPGTSQVSLRQSAFVRRLWFLHFGYGEGRGELPAFGTRRSFFRANTCVCVVEQVQWWGTSKVHDLTAQTCASGIYF